jgi:hypothetical protein
MSEKLLPCPRCGQLPQENRWHFYVKNPRDEMRYICANESCPEYNLKAMIIDEWNRRVYPPEVQAALDAARSYLNNGFTSSRRALREALRTLDEMEKKEKVEDG